MQLLNGSHQPNQVEICIVYFFCIYCIYIHLHIYIQVRFLNVTCTCSFRSATTYIHFFDEVIITLMYRYRELVLEDPVLRRHTYVPRVYPDLCTNRVLTTELVAGESIDRAAGLDQKVRNAIARTVLVLTIRELFNWRY